MDALLQKLAVLLEKLAASLKKPVPIPPAPAPAPVPVPPTPPTIPKPDFPGKIPLWAYAIKRQEGGGPGDRNTVNKNPGNLRYTEYTKTFHPIGKDADNFCIFDTFEDGFSALCGFLYDAASNKLIPYHDATLHSFTETYAQPPNSNYENGVAAALGAKVEDKISTFL
jgi:hypothetical protein